MAHQWHAGVLAASSWHGLESVETLPDAATLIRRGEESGAWPVAVRTAPLSTLVDGLAHVVPGAAVLATYQDGKTRAHGAVGRGYTPLSPSEWRATVEAAVRAGAQPTGAFALYGGARVVATFAIPGGNDGTGLANNLVVADSFDSSTGHLIGSSTIRVVCANTMAMFLRAGGHATVRHTASIDDAAKVLRGAMEEHIARGEKVKITYRHAREARVSDFPKATISAFLEGLYPTPTDEVRRDKPAVATKMLTAQDDFFRAMKRPENADGGGTVAELWNAATYLVDRRADGTPRDVRGDKDGTGRMAAMLFGSRGKEVAEVQQAVEELLANGETRERTVIAPAPTRRQLAPSVPGVQTPLLDEILNS